MVWSLCVYMTSIQDLSTFSQYFSTIECKSSYKIRALKETMLSLCLVNQISDCDFGIKIDYTIQVKSIKSLFQIG